MFVDTTMRAHLSEARQIKIVSWYFPEGFHVPYQWLKFLSERRWAKGEGTGAEGWTEVYGRGIDQAM